MATEYETGFYVDHGYYGGQEFIGADVAEALEEIGSVIEPLIYDYIYVAWEIDRDWVARGIAYDGWLDQTLDSIAEDALNYIVENTNENCGPVFDHIYWWERGFSDAPRPPPDAWAPPVVNVKETANRKPKAKAKKASKPKASSNSRPKKASKPKAALKVSRNTRPKTKAPARKTTRRYRA